MQKICLMVLIVTSVGCSGLPEFPSFNPKSLIVSKNYYFDCKLIDKEKMLFECDGKNPRPIDASLDGFFCADPNEVASIISWAKDVKEKYKQCVKATNDGP